MPRDTDNGQLTKAGAPESGGAAVAASAPLVAPLQAGPAATDRRGPGRAEPPGHGPERGPERGPGRGPGLSAKLLLFTIGFVMLAEILIFVPSVASFRLNWLNDRVTAAQLASLAAEAVPGGKVPDKLRKELLKTAQVRSVALKRSGKRRLVLMADMPSHIHQVVDLRTITKSSGFFAGLMSRLAQIGDALGVFFAKPGDAIRVIGEPGMGAGEFIEVVLLEIPLKNAMIQYGLNVLALSIIISMITAALVYFTLNSLLVRPITRITSNMLRFSQAPQDTSRIIEPSDRTDELGTAEHELAHMQSELAQMLHQKTRLAALGLAVSKINHDLRNMLASAQLISDRLGTLPDPTVQRFAPKLIASLDRAITFCTGTLKFGRAEEAAPRRDLFLLKPLVEEVGDSLGLPYEGRIGWHLEMDEALRIDADRDQLYRVLSNLARNAAQAIESQDAEATGAITVKAWRAGRRVCVEVSDDGPGVPARARKKLFQAFQGSSRKGGSGLGLAIAHELVAAVGGQLNLVDSAAGATFRIDIPDRSL